MYIMCFDSLVSYVSEGLAELAKKNYDGDVLEAEIAKMQLDWSKDMKVARRDGMLAVLHLWCL